MILLGITGGVGMGKSTAASQLAQLHVPSVDTDEIAHQIVEPGQPALDEIRSAFGHPVFHPDGRLNRPELARVVFSDPQARRRLEAILHPRIREVWLARVEAWRREDRRIGAVIIPLLFETGAREEFTATVCVACSAPTQVARLQSRGWTGDQIRQRIQAQWPVDAKMAQANFVLWNEGLPVLLLDQFRRILLSVGHQPG